MRAHSRRAQKNKRGSGGSGRVVGDVVELSLIEG